MEEMTAKVIETSNKFKLTKAHMERQKRRAEASAQELEREFNPNCKDL